MKNETRDKSNNISCFLIKFTSYPQTETASSSEMCNTYSLEVAQEIYSAENVETVVIEENKEDFHKIKIQEEGELLKGLNHGT